VHHPPVADAAVSPKGPTVQKSVVIENIDEMRRREGIDDVELRKDIRGLRVGDFVRLTLLTGGPAAAGETVLVRLTRIKGSQFRGKLASRPAALRLATLADGEPLAFTAAHIHSLPKGQPAHGR